jgi:hypothetical protein
MSGVAIEDLLELWSAELRKAKARLSWLIGHPSVVASAAAFLDTLLGPERRAGCERRPLAMPVPGASRRCWDAATGMPTRCAMLCVTMPLRRWPRGTRCWSLTRAAFSSRARHRAASPASTPARRARSPIARSASSPLMCPRKATPSSTGSSTCPRPGPTTRSAGRRSMCPRMSRSRPSRGSRSR